MKKTHQTTCRALLLFFLANSSYAGTLSSPDHRYANATRYGIDEQGRPFEYTTPPRNAPEPPQTSSLSPTTRKPALQYCLDENGRSVPYGPATPVPAAALKAAPPSRSSVARAVTAAAGTRRPSPAVTTAASQQCPAPQREPTATASSASKPGAATGRSSSTASAAAVTDRPTTQRNRSGTGTQEFIVRVSVGKGLAGRHLSNDLKSLGVRAVQSRVECEGKSVHRLLYARQRKRVAAFRDIATLNARGQKGYVIREKGAYKVYCGAFYTEERARKEQEVIAQRGFRVAMTRDAMVQKCTYLLARGFPSDDEARKVAAILQQRGFAASVMKADQLYALGGDNGGKKG